MDVVKFRESVRGDAPPANAGLALQALWHQAKGDWDQAHRLAQSQTDEAGAWVHAYLHRVEGDEKNAGNWYGRAGRLYCKASLEDEWAEIVAAL